MVVTGGHWTGSPNKAINQKGKTCPRIAFSGPSAHIAGHSDVVSTFPFSGLSNDFARHKAMAMVTRQCQLEKNSETIFCGSVISLSRVVYAFFLPLKWEAQYAIGPQNFVSQEALS